MIDSVPFLLPPLLLVVLEVLMVQVLRWTQRRI